MRMPWRYRARFLGLSPDQWFGALPGVIVVGLLIWGLAAIVWALL